MTPQRVELHIEEIVLDGFGDVDSAVLQQALQSEMTRILGDRGFAFPQHTSAQVPDVSAAPVTLPPGSDASAIGVQLAHAIAGGLAG